MKFCVVVPHYDHLEQFSRLLPFLAELQLPLIVVDDASPEQSYQELATLLQAATVETRLERHEANQGKGGAVMTGLKSARQQGYSHALQIDADGQHDTDAIRDLLAASREQPNNLVCGLPQFDEEIPALRLHARKITTYLCRLEALSTSIRDAMCGLRVYPLDPVVRLIEQSGPGHRMDFDPEILVRWVWRGWQLTYRPVHVAYPEGGKSHFHYLKDNLLISWMHTRLLAGMLVRSPVLLGRKLLRHPRGEES